MRRALLLGALFVSSTVACSAIWGFDDRSLASGTDGTEAGAETGSSSGMEAGNGDAAMDGPAPGPLTPPTAVSASTDPEVGEVITLAGTAGFAAYKNDVGTKASFNLPYGIVVHPMTKNIYVADAGNNVIRMVTPTGIVTTAAGTTAVGKQNGDRTTVATFHTPGGLALDPSFNIYVPDYDNNLIRFVDFGTNAVSTLAGSGTAVSADGTGAGASFGHPISLASDMNGNVYVADLTGHKIRKVTPTGDVSTIAGTGEPAFADGDGLTEAKFNGPAGIAVTPAGDAIYVSDNGNHRIRKITQAGMVSTIVGDGTGDFADGFGAAAHVHDPTGLVLSPKGDLFLSDSGNNAVRRIRLVDMRVTTLAGHSVNGTQDGKGMDAQFHGIQGIGVDDTGTSLYVADRDNHTIRKVFVQGLAFLKVKWSAPATSNSPIKSYTATATAPNQPTKSCTSADTKCTIDGLTSGIAYSISVTATNEKETSQGSPGITATPN